MSCSQYIFNHPDLTIMQDALPHTTIQWLDTTFYTPQHMSSVFRYTHSFYTIQQFNTDLATFNIHLTPTRYETLLRIQGQVHSLRYLNDSYMFMSYNEYYSIFGNR